MSIVGAASPVWSKSLHIDKDGHRRYRSFFYIYTDDRTDGPPLLTTCAGIPQYKDPYVWANSFDNDAFAQNWVFEIVDEKDTMRQWGLLVDYSTEGGRRQGSSDLKHRGNPINEEWQISGSFANFMRPRTHDRFNQPLQNLVEEPYIPAIETDDSRDTIILSKNTASIDLALRNDFRNKVNGSDIWGLKRRQLKLMQWKFRIMIYGLDQQYVENEFEVHVSDEKDDQGNIVGWTHVILQQGWRHVASPSETNTEIKYERNEHPKDQVVDQQMNLAQDGTLLPSGSDPVYRSHEIEDERDFSIIFPDPLPGPFL